MCCIFTVLVFLGPRFGILLWWLADPVRFDATFGNHWVIAILTFIFLPWTELMYMIVAPFGQVTNGPDIVGFDWVLLALAFITDILSYTGGFWGNRRQVYDYVPAAQWGTTEYTYRYTPPPSPPPSTPPSGST